MATTNVEDYYVIKPDAFGRLNATMNRRSGIAGVILPSANAATSGQGPISERGPSAVIDPARRLVRRAAARLDAAAEYGQE